MVSQKKTDKKVAPAPFKIPKSIVTNKSIIKKKKTNVFSPLFEKKVRNRGLGRGVQKSRDLSRFIKWPRRVTIQRQERILMKRLRIPPAINQFNMTLDKNTTSELLKFLHKYKPESKAEKKFRLLELAKETSKGEKTSTEITSVKKTHKITYGLGSVTSLVESKKASLVVISHDVCPIDIVVWLPALCRKMGVPYCIVKSKSRLGSIVHKKTVTAFCLTQIKTEDRSAFDKLLETIRLNFNDRSDEVRKMWGGGILSNKSMAKIRKVEKAKAKELRT